MPIMPISWHLLGDFGKYLVFGKKTKADRMTPQRRQTIRGPEINPKKFQKA